MTIVMLNFVRSKIKDMKNLRVPISIIAILSLCLVAVSCKKEKKEDDNNNNPEPLPSLNLCQV